MIRESPSQRGLAFAFATPRGGIDPTRTPEATHGVREVHRHGKSETASSTERPDARSFGERMAEARRDAERASARRMQSRVDQRGGDRSERSSPATANDRATAGESRTASGRDRHDAMDTAAATGTATSDGTLPAEAPRAASTASHPAETPVPGWTTGFLTAANPLIRAASGSDAVDQADLDFDAGADGASGAGGEPAMVADRSAKSAEPAQPAEPSEPAVATPVPSEFDPTPSGARRGASGDDPADFAASRLAQAADPAAIGATVSAPAVSSTPGTTYIGAAGSMGSAPVHTGGIATPLGDPAFAGHLAGETLKLAIAGVEHAEISVQPKDLGPIRIELSLNGESARIAFSATQPDTRQAIEQSLPILEDMLAEHGLLLADANVSDQRGSDDHGGSPAGRTPGSDPSPDRGHGPSGIDERGAPPPDGAMPGRLIRRGLVDLYA